MRKVTQAEAKASRTMQCSHDIHVMFVGAARQDPQTPTRPSHYVVWEVWLSRLAFPRNVLVITWELGSTGTTLPIKENKYFDHI